MSSLAFLARGRVFIRDENGAQRALESPFARTLQQQREETHRQRALHRRSFATGMPPQLQEQLESGPPSMQIRASGVCAGGQNQIFFSLSADAIGGYLSFDLNSNREQRLMHSTDFSLEHLDRSAASGQVACTVVGSDGTRAIGVMPDLGRHPDILTEGDALVMAPRWIPKSEAKALVFQSAGVARDGDGRLRERAPFEIERLTIETGVLETLASDAKHDFLGPVFDSSGALYAIRRPYSPRGFRPPARTFAESLLDVVMFLPRFGMALVGWANFFSWRYRGQGLSGQTPFEADNREKGERAAPVQIRAWGEVLTPQVARKLNRNAGAQEEAATWVSKEWQLVKRAPGSDEWRVLAEGVLSFDVAEDGTIFFCDGGRLFRLKVDGSREKVCAEVGIESVRVLS
jgi:hypothetical protein